MLKFDCEQFQVNHIIAKIGLEGWEERVTMLSWALKTYPGAQMMADPSLGIPPGKVSPLLDRRTVTTLQSEYLQAVSKDYQGTEFESLTR